MEKISENKKIIKKLFLLTLVCLFVLTIVSVVNADCSCKMCSHATPSTCVSVTFPASACPCTPQCTSNSNCNHKECVSGTCQSVPGPGSDKCTTNSQCGCSCKYCTHATPSTCELTTIPAAGCPCTYQCTSDSECATGHCSSGETECFDDCDPDDFSCCKLSTEYCQPSTGNKVYDTGTCSGSNCAYRTTVNCGVCTSGRCSISGCSCDSSCNIPVPGCDALGRLCTALAPDTCGYATTSCHPCLENYECRSEGGSIGCYICDCEDPTTTCSELGGEKCVKDEKCYGSTTIASDGECCVPEGACQIPTPSSCGSDDCFCVGSCPGPPLYYTSGSCEGTLGECCCISASASTCHTSGHLECEPEYGETTYTCPEDCGGSSPCTCGSWVSQSCGGWTCNDDQMYQTRTCTPSGCSSSTRRCVSSSLCIDTSVCVPGEKGTRPCGLTDVGECSYGTETRTCDSGGQWGSYGSCVGAVYPTTEICDGKDNDCDGSIDESLTTTSGCNQQGVCLGAFKTCSAGIWSACSKLPTTEICDNKDNDCDGSIDEGVTQPCYTGPVGIENVGICKGGTQTCSAGSWGSCVGEVTPQEEIYDNLDNDCDGYVDECVIGTVKNASLELIKGAEIKILGLGLSDTTDENGFYFICDFDPGTYDIVASKQGFNPVNEQFNFDGTEVVTVDFILYTAGSDCKPDCSKTTDIENPRCHADCDGINGCNFYDQITKEVCTTPYERVVGVTESYNSTHKLTCCKGSPYRYKKIPGTSLVFPEAENIVRITRIVFFRGQFARMIIDVFE